MSAVTSLQQPAHQAESLSPPVAVAAQPGTLNPNVAVSLVSPNPVLPSYEEANDLNAPPPTYESLFGKVEEVRKSSHGFLNFLKNLFFFLLGKIGLAIMIGVVIVIPLAMILFGFIYLEKCPAEKYIPIFLIVAGIGALTKLSIVSKMKKQPSTDGEEVAENTYLSTLNSLINCFLLGWFIAGCFWVYRIYEPNMVNPSRHDYCHIDVYTFAFWLVTSIFIIFSSVTLCLCCISKAASMINAAREL